MSDRQSIAATGVQETRNGESVFFHVAQHKYGQFFSSLIMLVATTWIGGIILSVMTFGGIAGVIIGAILLFCAAIGILIFGIGFLVTLLSLPGRRDRAEFSVSPSGVDLIVKQKGSYPARIARDYIQSLYIKRPKQAGQSEYISVVAGSPGLVAAHQTGNTAAAVGGGLGQLLGAGMAKTGWSVAITAYGQEILLATWLTESQASYLMHRVERAFGV